MVIVSETFAALVKVLFDKTGLPDRKERCLFIFLCFEIKRDL